MATHADAFNLCVKGAFHAGSTVLSLLPTDVKGLAEWLETPEGMKQGPWIAERDFHLGNIIEHCEPSSHQIQLSMGFEKLKTQTCSYKPANLV